jgi:hypothetical protein
MNKSSYYRKCEREADNTRSIFPWIMAIVTVGIIFFIAMTQYTPKLLDTILH